jgi:formamidopyrimidine-DNA glycosylase
MPELPEVETIRRGLAPAAEGRTVRDVRFTPEGERLLRGVPPNWFRERLRCRRIEEVGRRGKYLLFRLDNSDYFIAHLRMTGRFEVEDASAPESNFFRAALLLDDGRELRWRDVRRFGTWDVAPNLDAIEAKLGPEPLEAGWTAATLAAAVHGRSAPIKAILLDQRRVAGLGNIYVDEALHAARVHPLRPGASLSQAEVERLHSAVRAALLGGLENFGTTLRDFVNAYGMEGRNRVMLRVYGRAGEPCLTCATPIARIVVGGRGTHLCLNCQPVPGAAAGRAS